MTAITKVLMPKIPVEICKGSAIDIRSFLKKDPELEFVCTLHNWFVWPTSTPDHMNLGGNVQNHPKLGSPPMDQGYIVRTTKIKYFNEALRIAISRNTIYYLMNKAK